MKVLIVDDDVVDQKLIKRALQTALESLQVFTANSVLDGLEFLGTEHIDVILLDYKMPQVNGIEMLIELRSRPNLGETAIIMVSASEESSLAIKCIEAGAHDFLAKSEITASKLHKAILHARKRFELEQKMLESYVAVKEMAEMDQLTGLSNRFHFDETLSAIIANSRRTQDKVALLTLDVDNFKHVNDTMGHSAGDDLLKKIVKRINKGIRSNEGFARLGGDEFAVVLSTIGNTNEVSSIANRVLNTFHKPFIINDIEVKCTISIGAAFFPTDTNNSVDLIKYAHIAMYRAKLSGKNQLCFYEPKYQTEFNKRFAIHNQISQQLQSKSFLLHYQPVINMHTDEISSFEALIRWPDVEPRYNPDEFIPIAEETRLIHELGRWVIITALEQLKTWQENHNQTLSMAINISPIQLSDPQTASIIQNEIERLSISPYSVILEITETALFDNDKAITDSLNQLSSYGCKIALDDFGMGYSSIAHLMHYPIDSVKLDKSMQSSELECEKRENIFEALTLMLRTLDFEIVAEGIENEQQLALCKKLGIERGQGYLLGKPAPPSQLFLL